MWAEGIRLGKGAGALFFTEVLGIGCLILDRFEGFQKETNSIALVLLTLQFLSIPVSRS